MLTTERKVFQYLKENGIKPLTEMGFENVQERCLNLLKTKTFDTLTIEEKDLVKAVVVWELLRIKYGVSRSVDKNTNETVLTLRQY